MVPSMKSLSSHLSSSLCSLSPPSYIFNLTFPTDSFSLVFGQAHFPLTLKNLFYTVSPLQHYPTLILFSPSKILNQ